MRAALFLLLGLSCVAQASDPELSVVKIISELRNGSLRFASSGLLLQTPQGPKILATEHGVLHVDEKRARNRILLPNGTWIEARYVVSDWGYGLSLLEPLAALEDGELLPFEGYEPFSQGQGAIAMGYPADSETLVGSSVQNGSPTPADLSQVLAWVPGTFELLQGHGEFGMSGGGAFGPQGHWYGMLSHVRFQERGTAPRVVLIPSQAAIAWVRGILSGELKVSLFRDLNFQQQDPWAACQTGPGPQTGPYQGLMVSFRRIDDYQLTGSWQFKNRISIDLYHPAEARSWPGVRPEFFQRLHTELTARKDAKPKPTHGVEVVGFRKKHKPDFWYPWDQVTEVRGFAGFFLQLSDPEWEPIVIARRNGWDADNRKSYELGEALHQLSRETYLGYGLSSAVSGLAYQIQKNKNGYRDQDYTDGWYSVFGSDITKILAEYPEGWKELRSKNPGVASRLEAKLREIRAWMNEMHLTTD